MAFTLDGKAFGTGRELEGQYTIKCAGDSGFIVYSPLLDGRGPRPGEVRIFDSSGKLVSVLFEFLGAISHRSETEKIMVYPGDFLGTHFSLLPLPVGSLDMSKTLPPGDYKAQFVLYSYVVIGEERLAKMASNHPAPGALTPEEKEFETGKQVIAASKLVSFKIVRKPDSGAAN